MEAEDFTEEEVFMVAVEDFMEAGSGAEDFTAEAVSTGEGDSVVERDLAAEVSAAAAGFEAGPVFAEEPSVTGSVEVSVATASGAVLGVVSVFVDAAGVGEVGAGVGG